MSDESTEVAVSDGAPLGTLSSAVIRSQVSDHMQVLTTEPARYWGERRDLEVARLYQEDADQDGRESTASAVIPLAPSRSRSEFEQTAEGRELVAAWSMGPGGFDKAVTVAQQAAGSIVQAMGDRRHQQAFMTRFDREVSEAARFHIYNELVNTDASHPPATGEALAVFGSSDVGAELLAEWGGDAAYRVGRVWGRAARFRRSLDNEAEWATFRDWYDDLDPKAVKAIVKYLAR